jgi:DNA-binding protein YbaB
MTDQPNQATPTPAAATPPAPPVDPQIQALQEQSQKLQELLTKEQIVVEKPGVKLTMKGNQDVVEFSVNGVPNQAAAEAIAEACKKTQELAAQKLVEISTQTNS